MNRPNTPGGLQHTHVLSLEPNLFPPTVKGEAVLIGPQGSNHQFLQKRTNTWFKVRGQGSDIHLDVKYTSPADLLRLEILITQLAEVARSSNGPIEAEKLNYLPKLNPNHERVIREKYSRMFDNNNNNNNQRPTFEDIKAESERFYAELVYPSLISTRDTVIMRYRLIYYVQHQRAVTPQTHAAFLYNCHLLATVAHGLLTYQNFNSFYYTVFLYEVTKNVTLGKLLSRYPSVIEFVDMGVTDNQGIKAKNPINSSKEMIYSCIARDDWYDPECPSHIKTFWLSPETRRFLPGNPRAPPPIEDWGRDLQGTPPPWKPESVSPMSTWTHFSDTLLPLSFRASTRY
eukprot:GHVH01008850.1.p1 GENE.GHVH01008850.1~~GHVH01008850.1.p1  ORF type:complete len:344 (-),score=37.88 GHVH01008850.1:433-1464(-)